MTHAEKRAYLIKTLLAEDPRYADLEIPAEEQGQKDLLRSLMNVRPPAPVSDEYVGIESDDLKEETAQNPDATYACINYGEALTVEEIAGRSICIDGDIGEVLIKMA